jgi:hypothetical protein
MAVPPDLCDAPDMQRHARRPWNMLKKETAGSMQFSSFFC